MEAVTSCGPAIHPKKVGIALEFGNLAVTVQPFDHFLALGGGGVRLPLVPTISHRALLRSLDGRPLKAAKLYEFLGQICSFLRFVKGTRVGYGEVRNAATHSMRSFIKWAAGGTTANGQTELKSKHCWHLFLSCY